MKIIEFITSLPILLENYDANAIRPDVNLGKTPSIDSLVGSVITWVEIAAGVVAITYLIFSGFTYLTAGGNADAAKKGSQGILYSIIGLIIIALSYAIFTALRTEVTVS